MGKNLFLQNSSFPIQARVENTNLCNAHCTICPRESLTRKMGVMSYENFEKLVTEAAQKGLKDLHLQGFGEPFLDKEILNKIKLAHRLNIPRLFMVTNASLIDEEIAEGLVESGLHKLKISFYGTTKEEYELVHKGLSYEIVKANIDRLAAIKKKHRSRTPKIAIQYIGKLRKFFRFAFQWGGKAIPEYNTCHNYGVGKRFVRVRKDKKNRVCPMVKNPIIQILWDGTVVPCCYDYNGLYPIGNVLETSIEEVWNSEKYQAFRKIHVEREYEKIPMCYNCDRLR